MKDQLSQTLRAVVIATDPVSWQRALTETMRQFEVMDANLEWKLDGFRLNADLLLPPGDLRPKLLLFIDETLEALDQNRYLRYFFNQSPLTQIENHLTLCPNGSPHSPEEYLRYLVAFAFGLDRINVLCRKSPELLKEYVDLLRRRRHQGQFYRLGNFLPMVKLHSIELPLVRFLRARQRGFLSENFGKLILSVNIIEAGLVDLFRGNISNARVALQLIRFPPNYSGSRRFRSGAPSVFSPDGNALWMSSPFQRGWADLYQVWNMAFVSQFHLAPFLLVKLMIPSVASYKLRSAEYMHTRITALHFAMHFLDSAQTHPVLSIDLRHVGPIDPALTRTWGAVNLIASQDYLREISDNVDDTESSLD